MNIVRFGLAISLGLILAGCVLPEGTERVTGGTGKSLCAEYESHVLRSSIAPKGNAETCEGFGNPTTVSAELMLQKTDEGNFEGRLQFNDKGRKLTLSGNIFTGRVICVDDGGNTDIPTVAFSGPVRYKIGGGKFENGYVYGCISRIPAGFPEETPSEIRHTMLLCVGEAEENVTSQAGGLCDEVYRAVFRGGNIVFHGANAMSAR